MRSFTAVAALSALSMVAAQNSTAFTITPTNVDETTRNSWCIAQETTCNLLCDDNPIGNNCDFTTLNYYCTCQNASEPGLQYYVNTIDTFVCQESFSECNLANVGSSTAQKNCTTSIFDKCGTLDPQEYTAGSSGSSSGSTGSATPSATGSSSGDTAASTTAPTSTSSAGAMPTHLQHIGSGAAAAALGLVVYML